MKNNFHMIVLLILSVLKSHAFSLAYKREGFLALSQWEMLLERLCLVRWSILLNKRKLELS